MSLIWMDGFDNSSLWDKKYTLAGSTNLVAGRNGNCVQAFSNATVSWSAPSADEHATFIWGSACLFESTGNTVAFVQFNSDGGATFHTYLEIVAGGSLRVSRAGTTLATSAALGLAADTWYYIEMKATLHDTTGSAVVSLNGTEVINVTGVDTKNGGTKSVYDTVYLRGIGSTTHVQYDDMYILNGAGAAYNNFLGDVQVETIRPDGNGNSSQWVGSDGNSTDNYLLVDEATYDALDFVESATTNNKDLYTYGALAASTGTVKGVMALGTMAKTATAAQSARQITRIGGTNYNGSSVTLDTSDLPRRQVWEVSPATSSDWTISEVNGAEFGVEVL
jgi:hypothetical protein